jgi:DNA-binding MarR family transcriptional regulator|tara:strand:- start:1551 stop:1856 length:306 start_codon:yes stop_codon:yes gene_type:complete
MDRYVKINFNKMNDLNLNHKEYIVLNYIDSMCKNGSEDYCFASNSTICDQLTLSERTLYRILNNLEDKELILRKTKSIGHDGKERRIFSLVPSAKMADIYT